MSVLQEMALGGHAVCRAAGCNSISSGCKQQTLISHILERDVRDTGVGQWVPPEASPGRADAILSPCPHVGIPLCVSVSQSPQKDTSHMGSGPTCPQFTFITLLKAPLQVQPHSQALGFTMCIWGISQPQTMTPQG